MTEGRAHVPTELDLKRLPRWAQIALGVRCIDRALPLAFGDDTGSTRTELEAAREAVGVLYNCAAVPGNRSEQVIDELLDWVGPDLVSVIGTKGYEFLFSVNSLCTAAVFAIKDELGILDRHTHGSSNVISYLHSAISDATGLSHVNKSINGELVCQLLRDYDILLELRGSESWSDSSSVDSALLGPLWADGEPEGWPASLAIGTPDIIRRLNTRLTDFDLSVRASNCLESAKIDSVAQLVQMTDDDLLQLRSFGRTSLREVKKKLETFGLSLGMELPEGYRINQKSGLLEKVHTDDVSSDAPPLSLYFDTTEFTPAQISNIIRMLSELYRSVGGDRLVIDNTGVLEVAGVPQEVC